MSIILFDKFGSCIQFDNYESSELKSTEKDKYFFYTSLFSKEDEPFVSHNLIAYFSGISKNDISEEGNCKILFSKQKKPFIFNNQLENISSYFEDKNIKLSFKNFKSNYYIKHINFFSIKLDNKQDILYDTGYIVFKDGYKLDLKDITKIDFKYEEDFFSLSINTKKEKFLISNAIFYAFYNKDKLNGNLDLVFNIAGSEIVIPNSKRSDISLGVEKFNKISCFNNICKMSYFYDYITYGYLRNNKSNQIINIEFTPKEEHFLISL